jgi:MFS transporter, ACS family, tartrate transporter
LHTRDILGAVERMASGSAAADVIALINSIGNLAGSGGPYLIGGGKQAATNISAALLALGVLLLIACLPVLLAGQYQD